MTKRFVQLEGNQLNKKALLTLMAHYPSLYSMVFQVGKRATLIARGGHGGGRARQNGYNVGPSSKGGHIVDISE